MKSKQFKTTLSMLMMAAGGASLAACMEAAADKQVPSEQSVLAADEQTPYKQTLDEQTPDESTDSAKSATDEAEPRVSCRLVTAASIPVFTTPTSGVVRCTFPRGTRFSHFGAAGVRWITWCPLGVPPAQGTTSFAQNAGTVDGGCG